MDIVAYWKAALSQNADEMKAFFREDACVNWHNTNEHFTCDELFEPTASIREAGMEKLSALKRCTT